MDKTMIEPSDFELACVQEKAERGHGSATRDSAGRRALFNYGRDLARAHIAELLATLPKCNHCFEPATCRVKAAPTWLMCDRHAQHEPRYETVDLPIARALRVAGSPLPERFKTPDETSNNGSEGI